MPKKRPDAFPPPVPDRTDFISDLPAVEDIETDQTRRLQLLLEKQELTQRRGVDLAVENMENVEGLG